VAARPLTILFAVADHYEPYWGGANRAEAHGRQAKWDALYPALCQDLVDSSGRPPQHTFFYPIDQHDPYVLDQLALMRDKGLGDVEVHLHHDGDDSARLYDTLANYAENLHKKHGLLRVCPDTGRALYGFIHGDWALDNSRPDGRYCGVNDEISILAATGCYADFTLPSAPSETQTSTINSIYYATDDPEAPKSHDKGVAARVGRPPSGDLLMIQGILALNWKSRKWGLAPRIENSHLSGDNPPSAARIPLWLAHAPRVEGAPEVLFVKLHTHGASPPNLDSQLGDMARLFFRSLIENYDDGREYTLRFVTCWEMASAVHALEKGWRIEAALAAARGCAP